MADFDIDSLELSDKQKEAVQNELDTRQNTVRTINSELKTEKQEAIDKGRDIETKYNALLPQLEEYKDKLTSLEDKLNGNKESEDNSENIKAEIESKYADKLSKTEKQASALQDKLAQVEAEKNEYIDKMTTTLKKTGVERAMHSLKANQDQLQSVLLWADRVVMVGDKERPVIEIDPNGDKVFRDIKTGNVLSNENGSFDYNDFVNYLHDNNYIRVFNDANSSGLKGGSRATSNLRKSTMSQKDKQEFKSKNGIKAYDELPY